ncbi:MAG: hypothetical protein PHV36_09775 [Elusimicrobiales bacterium]|nr:hypothetical protein [Elusimicrobiales bacterium]
MKKAGIILQVKISLRRVYRRGEAAFYSLPSGLSPAAFRARPGQSTVEYLLMLAVVAGMASMIGVLFHRRILGGLFTLVGMIVGAGTPTS